MGSYAKQIKSKRKKPQKADWRFIFQTGGILETRHYGTGNTLESMVSSGEVSIVSLWAKLCLLKAQVSETWIRKVGLEGSRENGGEGL